MYIKWCVFDLIEIKYVQCPECHESVERVRVSARHTHSSNEQVFHLYFRFAYHAIRLPCATRDPAPRSSFIIRFYGFTLHGGVHTSHISYDHLLRTFYFTYYFYFIAHTGTPGSWVTDSHRLHSTPYPRGSPLFPFHPKALRETDYDLVVK